MLNAKFRAKPDLTSDEMDTLSIPYKDGWVYGYLVGGWMLGDILEGGEEYIQPEWWVSIQEGTRGQYTGLKDSEGMDIYTGDIIRMGNMDIGEIKFLKEMASFVVRTCNKNGQQYDYLDSEICRRFLKVIGNVWDNPEILEQERLKY